MSSIKSTAAGGLKGKGGASGLWVTRAARLRKALVEMVTASSPAATKKCLPLAGKRSLGRLLPFRCLPKNFQLQETECARHCTNPPT